MIVLWVEDLSGESDEQAPVSHAGCRDLSGCIMRKTHMLLKLLILVGMQLICGMGNVRAEPHRRPSSRAPKMLAAYWGIEPVEKADEQLHQLQRYGLNAALLKDTHFMIREKMWREWGLIANQHHIQLFPVFNFAGADEREAVSGEARPYINRYGEALLSVPCPLNRSYWQASVGQRCRQLAQLSEHAPIAGIVFDTEMYGGELSVYNDFCFCDICWEEFFQAQGHNVPNIEKTLRFDFLHKELLFRAYTTFQEKRLQHILSSIEKQTHAINPDLTLGILAYQDTWFYRGLIRGLGIKKKPVLVFSETSYILGYSPYIAYEKEAITGPHANLSSVARYIPGIWLGRFFPETLPAHLYALATHTDGYWLFSADSLWADRPQAEPYALHGDPQEYWKAFKRANDEIRQYSEALKNYKSSLLSVPLSSFYDSRKKRLITQPSLQSFITDIIPGNIVGRHVSDRPSSTKTTYRGTALFHSFKAPDDNSSGPINITHIPIAEYKDVTYYTLFNNKGHRLLEGKLDRQNSSVTLDIPQKDSGIVSLLIQSGLNAAQINFEKMLSVVEASSAFPLATFNTSRSYKVYVEPSQKYLNVRAYCSKGESALLLLQSSDKTNNESMRVVGFSERSIPTSSVSHWIVSVVPIPFKTFEDVKLYLLDTKYPYLLF